MKCPSHKHELVPRETKYGIRYHCPRKECTVVCWDGSTSTPADQETRDLRKLCHEHFDDIWKSKRMSRRKAYAWLCATMGLKKDKGHIGMMDASQCRRLLEFLGVKA